MARFVKAPDIWAMDDSERAKLQPGQWVRLGESGQLSRFYRFNAATGHVVAFHGPNPTRKLRQYVAGEKAAAERRAIRAKVREAIRAGQVPPFARPDWGNGRELVNADSPLPLWSGKGEPPAVGATVRLAGIGGKSAVITGYEIDGPWLMALGYRADEPERRGNLAGTEIIS